MVERVLEGGGDDSGIRVPMAHGYDEALVGVAELAQVGSGGGVVTLRGSEQHGLEVLEYAFKGDGGRFGGCFVDPTREFGEV